ncbi:MAG: cob(I)yrinic acid a,c-diamide adenosyltransferase [Nanoarchaeota archaeon]|nr:cob(I)yrinic acid a,c-diamide adenosyltransferase [Nanoarchaeota archaeon]
MYNLVMQMGMIYLFTGNGKGKTTSALGTAIRAIGYGKKVVVIQFMKKRETGEKKFFQKHGYEFYQFGTEKFVDFKNPTEKDKQLAKEGLNFAKEKLKEKPFLLVLDELNVAIAANLLSVEEVLEMLSNIPEETHIIITGRYAKQELIDKADLVTEMKEIKHPFQKGKPAIEGLDF